MKAIHAFIPVVCLFASPRSGSQIADPEAEIIEIPAGDRFLRWQAKAGHTYFIQTSDPNTHLENWIWAPCIESRESDAEISYEIGTTAAKAFFRIHHTDQSPPPGVSLEDWDADGDGLSNAFELSIQTNPLNPDNSGDGIPDGWAFVHGLNPLLDNSGGFFQSTETTNLAAYQAGVQANPNATLTDRDGDFRNNDDDVDPNDADLNWQRAGEASYVLIDLDVASTAGQARDINDKGEVLFDTGIWSGGEWIPIEAEPYQGIRPGPGENNDSNYEVNASNWMFFNDARQLTGYAELEYSGGPHSGQVGSVLQWTPGDSYSRHAPSALPFFDYNDGEASPFGISDDGTVFSRFDHLAMDGPEPVPTARILVTAANGTHQGLLSGQDGWHPIGSHGHSDVSGNGWLATNTASELYSAANHRLSLWNPSQTLVSLPAQANGFFFPLHLADLDEGQLLIAAGTQSGIDSEVFLSESGTAKHLPSLSGKNLRLFAGDGTGMTSDGKLWRNGELIPMRDLCQQWEELKDDDWSVQCLKANKHGVYLIQLSNPVEVEPRFSILIPVEVEDDVFSTGVDDMSTKANKDNLGYQRDFWIMAPVPIGPNTGNFAKMLIGGSVGSLVTLDADNAEANPNAINMGAPGQNIEWKGLGGGVNSEHGVSIDFDQGPQGIQLPISVKAMKRRSVPVKVWIVPLLKADGTARHPAVKPEKQELDEYLNMIFSPQVNATFDCTIHETQPLAFDTADGSDFGAPQEALSPGNGVLDTTANGTAEIAIMRGQFYDENASVNIYVIGGVLSISFRVWLEAENKLHSRYPIDGLADPDRRCVFVPAFSSIITDKESVFDTIAHEIGHVILGEGHPDEGDGVAPLQGTDHVQRLMCSGRLRDKTGESRRLVKAEWDEAENWFISEEEEERIKQ
jgi:hypothetical protein